MRKPPPVEYLKHLFQEADYERLVITADTLLTAEPENVRALYWRACALTRLTRMEEAFIDLEKAITLFDEYADAISQRGVLFFHRGELDRALEDMDRAVTLEPENPFRYSSRAYIKSKMDELESAIEDYQKAIELDPEDAVAHNNLGLLQEQLGYKSQAQRNLEKAAKMAVNRQGELVDQEAVSPQAEPDIRAESATYWSIIRNIFTTKAGFRGYWNYLKDLFRRG